MLHKTKSKEETVVLYGIAVSFAYYMSDVLSFCKSLYGKAIFSFYCWIMCRFTLIIKQCHVYKVEPYKATSAFQLLRKILC